MKANLSLSSISRIKIKIYWTFFILIAWIVFDELKRGGSTESVLFNISFVLTVILCVVLHELGHAITAKHFRINTKNIIENSNKNVLVEDVMSATFITIKSSDKFKKVYQFIYSNKQQFISVVKNGKPTGAIDTSNQSEYLLIQSKLAY